MNMLEYAGTERVIGRERSGMGAGYVIKCNNPFCKFERHLFAGIGMRFPAIYEEVLEKARKGEFSQEHADFLREHPDGALDAERKIFQCKCCGYYFTDYDLSMYLPKDGIEKNPSKGRWSVAFPAEGRHYVSPYALSSGYKLYRAQSHYCPKCNGEAIETEDVKDVSEKCPNCGKKLEVHSVLWD